MVHNKERGPFVRGISRRDNLRQLVALTVISIPTITLSTTPSAQPLKVHNRPTTIYQTTTITTLHVNVVIIDATTLTLVHVLAHVAVLVHVDVLYMY